MKIKKIFEGSTETTPLSEITEALYMYDIMRQLERAVENEPTKEIKVKFEIEIEY